MGEIAFELPLVTRYMAIDAGEPDMEGISIGKLYWEQCPCCHGDWRRMRKVW